MDEVLDLLLKQKPKAFWDYYVLDLVCHPKIPAERKIRILNKANGVEVFSTTAYYSDHELLEKDAAKTIMEIVTRGIEIPKTKSISTEKRFFPKKNKEK